MHKLFQLRSYLTYWLDEVDKHSLHSPFFFDFFTNAVSRTDPPSSSAVKTESLRRNLLRTRTPVTLTDLGAGSAVLKSTTRRVSDIARTSLSPAKYSALYTRIIRHYKLKTIVELGTSLGINTLHLASEPGTEVTTFEGARAIADIARSSFEFAGATNIRLIEGDINITLPQFLQRAQKIDFAFLDANHRYLPTLKYVHYLLPKLHAQSIVLLDDIHYSPEMEKAWNELKTHPLVYASADLFRVGILFFDPSLNKQHVVLHF